MSARRLLLVERLALFMFALLLLGALLYDAVIRAFWIVGAVAVGFLWLLAALFALFGIAFAFTDRMSGPERLRTAAAMPAALLAAWLLAGPVLEAGRWLLASAHLHRNHDSFEVQVRRAPPDGVVVFRYIEGVPDTGVSIVHSRRPPRSLPVAESLRVLGEPIRQCRRLRGHYHLCAHG